MKKIMEKKGKITIKKVPESPPATPLSILCGCPKCMSVGDRSLFSQLSSVPRCLSCVRVRHPKQTPGIRMLNMILLPHGPGTQANSFIFGSTEEKATIPKLLAELGSAARCCSGLQLGNNLRNLGNKFNYNN